MIHRERVSIAVENFAAGRLEDNARDSVLRGLRLVIWEPDEADRKQHHGQSDEDEEYYRDSDNFALDGKRLRRWQVTETPGDTSLQATAATQLHVRTAMTRHLSTWTENPGHMNLTQHIMVPVNPVSPMPQDIDYDTLAGRFR